MFFPFFSQALFWIEDWGASDLWGRLVQTCQLWNTFCTPACFLQNCTSLVSLPNHWNWEAEESETEGSSNESQSVTRRKTDEAQYCSQSALHFWTFWIKHFTFYCFIFFQQYLFFIVFNSIVLKLKTICIKIIKGN